MRDQQLEVWDDTMIEPGSNWREDIRRAIATAKTAIILVSADFLASEFIATNELPPLLLAAEIDGAKIIPVIISPSGFQQNPNLSRFQSINDPQRPLVNLKKGEQETIWVKVVDALKKSLSISPERFEGPGGSFATASETGNGSSTQRYHTGTKVATSLPDGTAQDEKDVSNKVKQHHDDRGKFRITRKHIKILTIIVAAAVVVSLAIYLSGNNLAGGELKLEADEAEIYLDLTSNWMELNEVQRKTQKLSKATLYGKFILRKYYEDATFSHRLGTSSVVLDPLNWRSDHNKEVVPTNRKCAAEVTTTYMLNFDIKDEKTNVPFELKYEIDFWNAHNGDKGDWHQFYVSSPTKVLTFKISFPKNKPYTNLRFLSGEGGDCSHLPSPHKDPVIRPGVDEKTGAKTITWTIEKPLTHWVYKIEWDW